MEKRLKRIENKINTIYGKSIGAPTKKDIKRRN